MRKYDKSNLTFRNALLLAYDSKDFYTGNSIELKDMEIDHIVPQKIFEDKKKIEAILEDCDLPSDFSKDCLINLVPTIRKPNSDKGDKTLKSLRFWLEISRFNQEKVESFIKNIRKAKSQNKVTVEFLESYSDKNEALQHAYELIKSGDAFNDREHLSESSYTLSTQNTYLNANLPSKMDGQSSCLIILKSLKLSSCMFVFNNDDIASYFEQGKKTDPHNMRRKFISMKNIDGGFFIEFGNASLILKDEETKDLCDVIDKFLEVLSARRSEIRKKFELDDFLSSSVVNGFMLGHISESLRSKIVDFACANDYEETNGEWSIFDPTGYYLKVFTDTGFGRTYRFAVKFTRLADEDISYPENDPQWAIVWSPILCDQNTVFSENGKWSAPMTRDFFRDKLIPYLIYKQNGWSKLFFWNNYNGWLKRYDHSKYFGNIQ